ncbi:site-specific DNA-methyltransferase [Citreimonas salinaria]|uniref:site-specific DNA-methyltransferase (adenine-specific) n=1 Tax=Citreimonas salinaria TaxID=321339 RepID=A0A1H3N8U3_9RHOB|nr:site-specific DNA-methyltransferase [Citreimonas salinaria]SDY84895.1 site-specific DNA-methyltransferase (adenine-specific)/adenine-specific DNA-methyltransferase [Citreimonas salinaria]
MPTLDWIGKQAVVNHHREVPYRLVHCDGELSAGDTEAGSLLVQGDNLEALRALLPYYAGKVKCIYIDPPYNTGNEGWVYNDNVNSPEIRRWLGEVVGKDTEDLSRHDKWLCMMYPRLRLLREFLREDGVIAISIDENEEHRLRALLDEVFGARCFMADLVWKSRQFNDARSLTGISKDHEKILVYERSAGSCYFAGLPRDMGKFKNPDNDPLGAWMSRSILGLADAKARPNLHFPIVDPATGWSFEPPANTGWRYSVDTVQEKIAQGLIIFPKSRSGRPREKIYATRMEGKTINFPSVIDDIFTADGTREMRDIFDEVPFAFPKPSQLVRRLISQVAAPDDIILDSFAGSGTTGHAVLDLNKQDGGNRRFILVELEDAIARDVTAERLRRVIDGYDKGGDLEKPVEGLGGGFRFCRLGVPLFDEFGDIADAIAFPDLAAHIFFAETGVPIPHRAQSEFLGTHQVRAVYLLFNEINREVPQEAAGNVLTPDRLDGLPPPPDDFEGVRVVYAEGCTVSADRLKAAGVVFKQIPYQVEGV